MRVQRDAISNTQEQWALTGMWQRNEERWSPCSVEREGGGRTLPGDFPERIGSSPQVSSGHQENFQIVTWFLQLSSLFMAGLPGSSLAAMLGIYTAGSYGGAGVTQIGIWIPVPSLSMALGKSPNLSDPPFPCL